MKKFLLALAMMLGIGGAALATPKTYYVSDCKNAAHGTTLSYCNGAGDPFACCSALHTGSCTGCYANASIANAACASAKAGGDATNPLCPDPGSDGSLEYAMYLFDGSAPDAAADDTVKLCADQCAGGGTAVFAPMCTSQHDDHNDTGFDSSRTYWFSPSVGGTSGHPITITNNATDLIVFTGDTNGNRAFDDPGTTCAPTDTTKDLDLFGVHNGQKYIVWQGNDLAAATAIPGSNNTTKKGIVFQKTHDGWYFISQDGGPQGWKFDGVLFQHIGTLSWAGNQRRCRIGSDGIIVCDIQGIGVAAFTPPVDFFPACYDSTSHRQQPFTIKVTDQEAGTFNVSHTNFFDNCAWLYRLFANNPTSGGQGGAGGAAFTFDSNNSHNTGVLANVFWAFRNLTDPPSTYAFTNSTFADFYDGIGLEEDVNGVTITDNTFSCPATNLVTGIKRCGSPIIASTDQGGSPGTTSHITIARNKFWGTATNPSYSYTNGITDSDGGWFDGPAIRWADSCDPAAVCQDTSTTCGCSTISSVIENNMIWHYGQQSGNAFYESALGVINHDNPSVQVRNNTIFQTYGAAAGIYFEGTGNNPTVINNIVQNSAQANLNINNVGLANFKNNTLLPASRVPVVKIGGAVYDCTQVNGGLVPGMPTTNFNACLPSLLLDTANADISKWDLHLNGQDTSNADRAIDGATNDIDKETRPTIATGGKPDIGADERSLCGSFEPACSAAWTIASNGCASNATTLNAPLLGWCQPVSPLLGQTCTTAADDPCFTTRGGLCDPGPDKLNGICKKQCSADVDCPTGAMCAFEPNYVFVTNGTHTLHTGAAATICGKATISVGGLSTACTYKVTGYSLKRSGTMSLANNKYLDVQVDSVSKCKVIVNSTTDFVAFADGLVAGDCTFTPGAATVTLGLVTPASGSGTYAEEVDGVEIVKVSCP